MIRAARYLGVAPWTLAKQPQIWMDWALLFEQAEFQAEEIAEKIGKHRRGERNEKDDDDEPET